MGVASVNGTMAPSEEEDSSLLLSTANAQSAVERSVHSVLVASFVDGSLTEADEEAEMSNEEYDSQGGLKVDFESDCEYDEIGSLQKLAYQTGRAQVRRDLTEVKGNRGFVPPPLKNSYQRPATDRRRTDKSTAELMARTRCYKRGKLGHLSRQCPENQGSDQLAVRSATAGPKGFFRPNQKVSTVPPDRNQPLTGARASVPRSSATGRRDARPSGNFRNSCFFRPTSKEPDPQYEARINMMKSIPAFVGIVAGPGQAVVDTAAETGCVGESGLETIAKALAQHGWKYHWVERPGDGGPTTNCIGVGAMRNGLGRLRYQPKLPV